MIRPARVTARAAAPRDATITVIGGGAIGCAVAFRLAAAGHSDVQVIEKGDVAAATTGQAAGLVGQVRASPERTRLAMSSVALYRRLGQDAGHDPEWREVGSLRLALNEPRVEEFRHMADVARSVGLEVKLIDAGRAKELCPPLDASSVRAALWCPSDGYLQPYSLTMAYVRAAARLGVSFVTHTTVTGIGVRNDAVTGVQTDRGAISTETVINAAGPWANLVARMVGLELPIFPVRHEYFITEEVGWSPDMPVLRIPDVGLYVRPEIGSVLCGGWEDDALSLDPRIEPAEWGDVPIEPDWDVLARFAGDLASLFPGIDAAGVRAVFRGWPSFTPDGRFLVGPVPGLRGFVMAAGCNAHGVSGSAGLAQHLIESLEEDPSAYVRSLSPGRFIGGSWDWDDSRRRAQSVYETYYALSALAQGGAPGRHDQREPATG
ncbi:MAG: NAD(P)/FAD-dependent oxidoreductase [Actinomycetota bacterium]